jgi:HemY protein
MIRLTFYILLAVLIAVAASWIAAHPGEVILNWQGWELRMPFAMVITLTLLYTGLLWLLFKLISSLKNISPLKNPARQADKRVKGLKELDLGWSALTLDDRSAALKHARRAKNLLEGETGPLMLLAQAETTNGRKQYLAELEKHQETSAWVKKHQLEALMEEDNFAGALLIAKEIEENYPASRWVKHKIFDLEARLGRWEEAEQSLQNAVKSLAISPEEKKHFSAVLDYNQAMERHAAGDKDAALALSQTALNNDPSFIPAAIFTVRALLADGHAGKAHKALTKAWAAAPHPEMAVIFKELDPTESPTERFRRAVKLTLDNPELLESAHLIADTALQSQHWAEAKSALMALVKAGSATTKTYQLLARLEQQQSNDKTAAEAYLKQAATAAVNPHWSCHNCGTDQQHYLPHCPSCHHFDTVVWPRKTS